MNIKDKNEPINTISYIILIISIMYILTDYAKTGQVAGLILLTVMIVGTFLLMMTFGIIGILESRSDVGISTFDFSNNIKTMRHIVIILEHDLKDLKLQYELLKGDNDALKQEVLDLKLQVMLDGNWKDTSKNNKTVSHTV